MSPTITAATVVETTEPAPTAGTATAIPPAAQPHAGNMTEHIYGKTAPTTGSTQTAAMPIQEIPAKPPTPILKVPAQGGELEGKSRVQ
jgi:hypothetical protein